MPTEVITDINELDLDKSYTIADYMSWKLDERVELIRGKIFRMSPAPSSSHQRVSWNLNLAIGPYFGNSPCQAFAAPFDVRLISENPTSPEDEQTVVQPDICVICDEAKIRENGCWGAPDWIIEIISPSTAKKDIHDKFQLYEKAGVKEYWMVFPQDKEVLTYVLDEDGHYIPGRPGTYKADEKAAVHVFPDLEVNLEEVFRD